MEFKNLKQLMTQLSDEDKCRRYMEGMRWGDSPFCPFCNGVKPYRLKDGKTYRCKEKTCKKDFTVTTKTVFENSKVKLSTWLAALFVLSQNNQYHISGILFNLKTYIFMYKHHKMAVRLTSVTLENFKCFKKEKTFNFSKLTILTGANSSGKSSILHSILGALQTRDFPLRLSPNGKYINMGDFREISYKHDSKNRVRIDFTFKGEKNKYNVKTTWVSSTNNYLPQLYSFKIETIYSTVELFKKNNYYLNYEYDPEKDPEATPELQKEFRDYMIGSFQNNPAFRSGKGMTKEKREKEMSNFNKYIDTYFEKKTIKNIKIEDVENLEEEIDKVKNLRLNMVAYKLIRRVLRDFDEDANLISSFRSHPDRTYLEKSRDERKIGKFGEGYLDQIVSWERRNPQKSKELIDIMKSLKMFNSISSNRIGGGRYELLINTKRGGTKTSLFDVGFGISQFLPVIVADIQLPNNSTLIVAEPEIHLHPSVQAEYATFLSKQIKSKNKNYIIETHSEYFLNRIRLEIIKGNYLKESDVSIYYLENDGKDVSVYQIKFGKKGQIEGAPESFFNTYLMDIRDIALNV